MLLRLTKGAVPFVAAALICSTLRAANTCGDTVDSLSPIPGKAELGMAEPIVLAPMMWAMVGGATIYPVEGLDGKVHLAYEVAYTATALPLEVESIEVVDACTGIPVGTNRVLSIKNENITSLARHYPFSQPETLVKSEFSNRFTAGQTGFVYFDVVFDHLDQVPKAIAHRAKISFEHPVGKKQEMSITGGITIVNRGRALILSPPLRGSGWLNGNGCCLEIGPHRAVLLPANGTLRPAEHFAIDFVKLNHEGLAFHDDPRKTENWFCYESEVVAAGSGMVVEAVDQYDNQIPNQPAVNVTAVNAAGNHVIIDMGAGHYALYAHLAPRSVSVSLGHYVRQGARIGLVGNTGSSTAPHLHFQVMNRPSALDAYGLPFLFDQFQYRGSLQANLADLDDLVSKGKVIALDGKGSGVKTEVMPLSRSVMDFN
jgi:hypothetical protein